MKHIVIAGGGPAAIECAVAARKQDPECAVSLICKEPHLPYRRPALSALAANDDEPTGTFFIKDIEFFHKNNISLISGVSVKKIDASFHAAYLSDGTAVEYTKLIIATGAVARRIPVPGADGENVLVLRELSDLMKLRKKLVRRNMRVAVIGGGLLGLELADSLIRRGCQVTVIESAEKLLMRNLDLKGCDIVTKHLAEYPGLTLLTGRTVKEITPQQVIVNDGAVECDAVFFSAGAVPCFPDCEGLAVNRGIVVDTSMQSSLADIYAAGDVAEIDNVVCGLYTMASKMGSVAGNCAAGGCEKFVLQKYPARLNALGIKMFSAGVLDELLENEIVSENGNYCRKFYRDGRVAGAVLIGDQTQAAILQKQLNS